jgi:hypothetical protein
VNLHQIVRGHIAAINPMTLATLQSSLGSVINPDGSRSPSYAQSVQCWVQMQSLTFTDLQMLDGLDQQGERRAIYLNGAWNGTVRVEGKGGDLLTFDGQVWLVVQVLESWVRPGWTKLAVTLQNGA